MRWWETSCVPRRVWAQARRMANPQEQREAASALQAVRMRRRVTPLEPRTAQEQGVERTERRLRPGGKQLRRATGNEEDSAPGVGSADSACAHSPTSPSIHLASSAAAGADSGRPGAKTGSAAAHQGVPPGSEEVGSGPAASPATAARPLAPRLRETREVGHLAAQHLPAERNRSRQANSRTEEAGAAGSPQPVGSLQPTPASVGGRMKSAAVLKRRPATATARAKHQKDFQKVRPEKQETPSASRR